MDALTVKRVSKDFGGVRALVDVSFSVRPGERLAIIGPNGAGKTTLFNVLNGQLAPTSGRVYFVGLDVTRMPTHRRAHLGLARSFQVTNLFSGLTVARNALLAVNGTEPHRFQMLRSSYSYSEAWAGVERLLRAWALWDCREQQVRNLSHGEQRRLEIALSLAAAPKVLLLDEPSAGLTAAESANIVHRIRTLGGDTTVALVAHDMDLVFGVADRIIVLHQGRIIAEGGVREIQSDARVREVYMGGKERPHDVTAG